MRWLLALVLVGCSSGSVDPAPAKPREPRDEAPAPAPAESPELAPKPAPDVDGGASCTLGDVVTYPIGRRCGLAGAGRVQCPGETATDGFVYVCEGPSPSRPDVLGCHDFVRFGNETHTLCPAVRCTPFDAPECGSAQGFACPSDTHPGVGAAPSPPGSCQRNGWWSAGEAPSTAYGPLFCCR